MYTICMNGVPSFWCIFCFVWHCAGPVFFLSCFSVAVGVALLYYYGGKHTNLSWYPHQKSVFPRLKALNMFLSAESKQVSGSSSALGLAAMGLSRKVRDVLIWYTEDGKWCLFCCLKKEFRHGNWFWNTQLSMSKISKHILFQVLQKYVHTMYIETLLLGFRIRMAEFQR